MLLSSHMPDLASFEVLLAIAKTGSLGAAAREVGLTQQAVSARLASMEAQTGVQLAVRTARGSQLTPGGLGCNCRQTAPADSPQSRQEISRGIREGLAVSVPGLPAPAKPGQPRP